jgi:hypothetical protein
LQLSCHSVAVLLHKNRQKKNKIHERNNTNHTVQTIRNTANTSIYITKTPTHTHTHAVFWNMKFCSLVVHIYGKSLRDLHWNVLRHNRGHWFSTRFLYFVLISKPSQFWKRWAHTVACGMSALHCFSLIWT